MEKITRKMDLGEMTNLSYTWCTKKANITAKDLNLKRRFVSSSIKLHTCRFANSAEEPHTTPHARQEPGAPGWKSTDSQAPRGNTVTAQMQSVTKVRPLENFKLHVTPEAGGIQSTVKPSLETTKHIRQKDKVYLATV